MKHPLFLTLIIFTVLFWSAFAYAVHATILEKEPPPPVNGTGLDLSEDTIDTDIEINVDDMEEDALFENRTQMISTDEADDIDIDGLPPEDVTIIISNKAVIVTKNPVIVEFTDEATPYIIDEIADVAREQSDDKVIIKSDPAPTINLLDEEEEEEDDE